MSVQWRCRAAMPDPSGGGDSRPKRPLFAAAEERDMVAWMTRCAAFGLIITREMFLEEVQRIVHLEQRGDKSVGVLDQWISEFRCRHAADLSPSGLLPAHAAAERQARRSPLSWYRSVSAALAKRHPSADSSLFSERQRVLYLGEVNLRLDPRTATVAALRTTPTPGRLCANDNVAYVQAVSASGERAPPMLVLPAGDLVWDDLEADDACFRQTTSTGRVTPTALIQYMVKSLEPHLMAGAVQRPVLIYVDGLQHHCSMTLTQFCDDEGIIMVGLPPGGQARNPLQQAVTSLLAANFDRLVAEARLGRRRAASGAGITLSLKYLLAGIRQACRRVCKETVAQAFTSSSLFPWCERVVAACETADVPCSPPSAAGGDGPEVNGVPRRPGRDGRPRTPAARQPNLDITIKHEQLSPSAADWDADMSGADDRGHGRGHRRPSRDQPDGGDDLSEPTEPDQLVLPQARLTEYLGALDAAGAALSSKGSGKQASVVLELKAKLRALRAASCALPSDCPEPPAGGPAAAGAADDNHSSELVCAVSGCTGDGGRARLHRFPSVRAVAAVWLERCGLPPDTLPSNQLAVCQLHFTAVDLLPTRSPDGDDCRQLRPAAVPTRRLDRVPPSAGHCPSQPAEGRAARGIKRPKRFDDFECVDDAPLRPSSPPPVPDATAVSPDMTELANKPPAALKSIIGILRTENSQLRRCLEAEQGRGRSLVASLERLARDYRAGAPP